MCERHLLNESFFKFFIELITLIPVPELSPESKKRGYDIEFSQRPPEVREGIENLTRIIRLLITQILPKSQSQPGVIHPSRYILMIKFSWGLREGGGGVKFKRDEGRINKK